MPQAICDSSHSLTLAVIARNEERVIARCLGSARSIASEMIVVDTGYNGATPDLASKSEAKVIHHHHRNHPHPATPTPPRRPPPQLTSRPCTSPPRAEPSTKLHASCSPVASAKKASSPPCSRSIPLDPPPTWHPELLVLKGKFQFSSYLREKNIQYLDILHSSIQGNKVEMLPVCYKVMV
jgi:hypothetical protein